MPDDHSYRIALSFFPLSEKTFQFKVWRRACETAELRPPVETCKQYKLPTSASSDRYVPWWVTFTETKDWELFPCTSDMNRFLTVQYLFEVLLKRMRSSAPDRILQDKATIRRSVLSLVLKTHPEGSELVCIEPYFLKKTSEFGILADFKFDAVGPSVTSRTLELSLSLKNGRANRDFYADRFGKIKAFQVGIGACLFSSDRIVDGIHFDPRMREIEARQLNQKVFCFSEGRTSTSQFMGIKQYGPLARPSIYPKVFIVYRSQDRELSRELYKTLTCNAFNTFPGMNQFFGVEFDPAGIETNGFDTNDLRVLCDRLQSFTSPNGILPIVITPFKKGSGDTANKLYFSTKHAFLSRGWPSQFVSREILMNRNTLKWSISNIALQIFAKMGGQPWKVKTNGPPSLIIGIGQAHRIKEGTIQKYFAYSVLTDSSGIYEEMRVLSASSNHENYISDLKRTLNQLFQQYRDKYDRFVLHATYSIRREELNAIDETIATVLRSGENKPTFVVLKFNDRNKFFGYCLESNSLVPLEASFIDLNHSEYLIWFEGLQTRNPTITKRVERPLHIEVLHPRNASDEGNNLVCLQEAVNLSGANWRGFNSKSLPVSVYYAKLIADYFKEFHCLDLPEIDLQTINPWFL